MRKLIIKTLLPLLVLPLITPAQKLPNVQTAGVYAPSGIKIDGKATEWNNKFKAHNNATDINYTLSNDEENLYLTVQARYQDVMDKILRGGITLTINHALSKKDNSRVAITYPVLRGADEADMTNMLARKEIQKKEAGKAPVNVDDINQLLENRSKLIKVTGIKSITDESISVYNTEGIKAAAKFDKEVFYTYELAVPLKYLGLPDNGKQPFSYNIKVNPPDETPRPRSDGPPPPPMAMTSTAPTDFWGIYTLAKK